MVEKEEAERNSINCKGKLSNQDKMTRAMLLRQAEEAEAARKAAAEERKLAMSKIVQQPEPTENLNRAANDSNAIQASSVDEAIAAFDKTSIDSSSSSSSSQSNSILDRHPEKRMKSAYAEYEEREMEVVKAENPHLKLSQYKEIIFKNWQKSPENPINARKLAEESIKQQSDAWKYGNHQE